MKYVNEAYDFVNHAWSKGKIQKLIAPLEGLAYCTTVKGFKEVGLGVQPEESNYFNFFYPKGRFHDISLFYIRQYSKESLIPQDI